MKFERETVDGWWNEVQRKGAHLLGEMVWGFFFAGESEASLRPLIPILEEEGFEYVGTLGDVPNQYLHVQLVERTTAERLHARLVSLHELGEQHGVDFDGWDVGNVDGSVLY